MEDASQSPLTSCRRPYNVTEIGDYQAAAALLLKPPLGLLVVVDVQAARAAPVLLGAADRKREKERRRSWGGVRGKKLLYLVRTSRKSENKSDRNCCSMAKKFNCRTISLN
jgi:hypothetical protein